MFSLFVSMCVCVVCPLPTTDFDGGRAFVGDSDGFLRSNLLISSCPFARAHACTKVTAPRGRFSSGCLIVQMCNAEHSCPYPRGLPALFVCGFYRKHVCVCEWRNTEMGKWQMCPLFLFFTFFMPFLHGHGYKSGLGSCAKK